MGKRELFAFVAGPIVLAAIRFLPPWVYLGLIWLVTLAAAAELVLMLRQRELPVPLVPSLVVLGVALPLLWWKGIAIAGPLVAAIVLILPTIYLLGRFPVTGAASAMAISVFAVVYFLVTAGAMGFLRTRVDLALGWKIVFFHCLVVWGGDSGAYYAGRTLGRHRMAPVVSPKKTWEGFAGGVAATFFGVWFCHTVFFPELPWRLGLTIGAVLAVVVPVGDLVESLLKRDAGTKDSSQLIPGHGGFLDRSDSLFFAAPLVLALFLLLGLAP
ncbi:MAG TPA: phosphatidate cytidylyltransferase [Thermoanaerobaculaceae bacterium]|nr:phosphatidate cytidylyltransferase [Thermoanaerobaculaceae bacterium]HPS77557.1 phosphatidate cytidylyltransferase [Thermoanaerobaculaceae bacterium]